MDAQAAGPPDYGKGLVAERMALTGNRGRLWKILGAGSVRGGLLTGSTGTGCSGCWASGAGTSG